MSTRASIILKDSQQTLFFYRHSDGYPETTGKDLADFVKGYAQEGGTMRPDVMQSAGWLVVRGHAQYLTTHEHVDGKWTDVTRAFTGEPVGGRGMGWKVGAYEPATGLIGGVEFVYIIDLEARTLTCRVPTKKFWDKPDLKNTTACKDFGPVPFDPPPARSEEDVVDALAGEVRNLFDRSTDLGRMMPLKDAVALVLKVAEVGPERETRRAHDGVSAAEFLVEKMIAEMLTTEQVNS